MSASCGSTVSEGSMSVMAIYHQWLEPRRVETFGYWTFWPGSIKSFGSTSIHKPGRSSNGWRE